MRNSLKMAFAGITAGMLALFGITAQADATDTLPADCHRVATADRTLCHRVYLQHPYGAAYGSGGWSAPNGKALVREITHQGYTKAEMHDALVAEASNYRLWVTAVPVNMDDIKLKCGSKGGAWVIDLRDEDGKPGGVKLTRKRVVCA